jgi:septum formation protein
MLILGSSSSYRSQLLEKLGLEFETFSPTIDESRNNNESPKDFVLRLSLEKAQNVAKHKAGIIIASDQVAVNGGEILGKPNTQENAIKQLLNCSGKRVDFLTGLCVLDSKTGKSEVIVDKFSVHFKELNLSQITSYIKKENPLNCAGSFKSEGLGIALFEKLEGDDPNSLIGLPLIKLINLLEKFDIKVL